MSESNGPAPAPKYSCVSSNPNSAILYDDGEEADTTVRPIPPERLAQAIAERNKIEEWRKKDASQPKPQADDAER